MNGNLKYSLVSQNWSALDICEIDVSKRHLQGWCVNLSDGKKLIYRSQAIQDLIDFLLVHVPLVGDIMILAESGAGKELAARLIYDILKPPGKFVGVACPTLGESLFESELFGHERGAFTGATTSRKGLMEQAQNGVLFLDEFGDLPLPLQLKLLRTQQERQIRRVGGNSNTKVNFRIVAATNRDLGAMIRAGEFRHDLAYRFGFEVRIPPLRERTEDILFLAYYFLDEMMRDSRLPECTLDESAEDALLNYDYPGNIRELEDIVMRSVGRALKSARAEAGREKVVSQLTITDRMIKEIISSIQWKRPGPACIQPSSETKPVAIPPKKETADQMRERWRQEKRFLLVDAFQSCGGDIIATAAELGMRPKALRSQLKRHHIVWKPSNQWTTSENWHLSNQWKRPMPTGTMPADAPLKRETIAQMEARRRREWRARLRDAFHSHNGDLNAMAAELGMRPKALWTQLKRHPMI